MLFRVLLESNKSKDLATNLLISKLYIKIFNMKVERMKKRIQKGISKLAFFAVGFAIGMVLAGQVNAQKGPTSLLWKIEGKGLAKPSYLYGTIHLICPDDFFMTDATTKALDNVEQVVMELDMDDPQIMVKMQQMSVSPNGENISSELSDEEAKLVNEFFKTNYGVDLSQLGMVKPFALLSMVLMKSINCDQPASYETSFVQEAAKRELEVSGLETVAFQVGLFDDIPRKDQVSWLVETISEKEDTLEEFNRMVAAYKKQDLHALFEIILQNDQFTAYADPLLYQRNKDWIGKIEALVKDKPTFIAVGAGHLGSKKGVVSLLRKEGYKVSPVK